MLATDAMIGNLEGRSPRAPKWHGIKAFYFRADQARIAALKAGNYRCIALASNHMLDFGDQVFDTRRHLAEAGIAFAGAGGNADEAAAPVVFEAGGVKIGFISITNTVRSFAATRDRPGTNYWKIRTDRTNLRRLATLVHDLRQDGAF
jgi:poly-gamma-glutamate synthesis protein (capsule biosynthesis protein)